MNQPQSPYQPPTIQTLGTLRDLTQGGPPGRKEGNGIKS